MTAEPLSTEAAVDLAKMFKALSDPVRLRLLSLIASHADGEVCVCDLTGEFDVTAPTISFHLRVLRETGLVGGERRGTWVYYRVNQPVLRRLQSFLDAGGVQPAEDEDVQLDKNGKPDKIGKPDRNGKPDKQMLSLEPIS